MIYHLSLHTAGIIAGAFLVVVGVLGLMKPDFAQVMKQFPRSRVAGIVLLTICLAWTMWLLATIQMGEFASFRRPLLIALPIGYVLALFYATLGLPIARWADRGNRSTITSLAIGLWGVMVMSCLMVSEHASYLLSSVIGS